MHVFMYIPTYMHWTYMQTDGGNGGGNVLRGNGGGNDRGHGPEG